MKFIFYMKFMKQAFCDFHKFSYEMTGSVRFRLSYDCFKLDFIALKVDIISMENVTLSRTRSWRYAPVTKCYVTCGIRIFMK